MLSLFRTVLEELSRGLHKRKLGMEAGSSAHMGLGVNEAACWPWAGHLDEVPAPA